MAWFKKAKTDRQTPEPRPPQESGTAVSSGTTHLGPGLRIRGNVAGKDPIRIEGRLEGDILLESELVILPAARLQGNLKAPRMTVGGTVEGEIESSGNLHIQGSAVISGNIRTPKLKIGEGAVINGRISMDS